MSDLRPSDNTDDRPGFPEMKRRGFFDDLPTGDDFLTVAIAEAVGALAEQQRIANLIAWQHLSCESYRAEIRKGLGI